MQPHTVLPQSPKVSQPIRVKNKLQPLSNTPRTDTQAEVGKDLNDLQTSHNFNCQKDKGQEGNNVSSQVWPERKKLPP